VLSALFAVIGAVPLFGLGILARTTPVRAWAAEKTSALIRDTLGVTARYDVAVQTWPFMISLDHVVVDAADGGSPFLTAERITLRPRLFSLLALQADAGDVEILGPRVRLVMDKGEITNLRYKLPEPGPGGGGRPFASVAVTDARVDATVDGALIGTRELDVDLSAEEDDALEVALRTGATNLTRVHPVPGRERFEDAVDEDVICRLEARVRVQGRSLLVRRLLLEGSADFDPDPGTRPACKLADGDPRAFEVRLGAVRIDLREEGMPRVSGRVRARVPAPLVHRFVDLAHVSGSVAVDLEGEYDGVSPLPLVTGHVTADNTGIDGKVFGKRIDLDVSTSGGVVKVTHLVTLWADGKLSIPDVTIEPFAKGVPIATGPITFEGIEMHALLRDLGAHPQAHVAWTLEKGRFEYMRGRLSPPLMDGPLTVQTRGFEIFDRPVVDPARAHMMGVREGTVRTTFVINGQPGGAYKLPGIVLANTTIETPRSRLHATVTLGFASVIDIQVFEGSKVDLSEISPLGADISLAGTATLRASGRGPFEHPKLTGELSVSDFVFAGLPIGQLDAPRLAFEPLVLDLFDARIRHNKSLARSQQIKLAFDTGATVVADADVDTNEAPGLSLRDLLEVFHFDKDPRFDDLDARARGKARVHYALGGREDRCGGGLLGVTTSMGFEDVRVLGERWDSGTVDADVLWDDQPAGTAGLHLDLRSATLRKGDGSVLVGATVRHGGLLKGNVIASGIPLSRLDAFGAYGKFLDGTASMVGEIGGTMSALEGSADVNVSRVRIGPESLGPSRLKVALIASRPAGAVVPRACGNGRGAPPAEADPDRDPTEGDFRIDGALFDGQVALDDVRISRQRHKDLRGKISARALDLGTLANLVPGLGSTSAPIHGSLTATLAVKSLPLDTPQRGAASLSIDAFELERKGGAVRLERPEGSLALGGDELTVPPMRFDVRSGAGLAASLVAGGAVHRVTRAPDMDLSFRLDSMDLSRLRADVPSVERSAGTLDGNLHIAGPPTAVRYGGAVSLHRGELALKGLPVALSDVDVDVEIADGDARLKSAHARVGGGQVEVTGRMPLRGPDAGAVSANIDAKGVKLPVADGVTITADAQLLASYLPGAPGGQRAIPDVKGTVELTQFSCTRVLARSINAPQLGRAQRTDVDAYDPADDFVHFNVKLVSPRPLRFSNKSGRSTGYEYVSVNDMDLEVMNPGLVLSGTNQRFGARGMLRVLPDSKLQFVNNEFLVREGYVRFDDPTKIAPVIDLRAQTEYRRYTASAGPEQAAVASSGGGPTDAPASPAQAAASTSAAGIWRITLQARGETDNLKVSMSSDPPLSAEDIYFLLTIGMTRAEVDRASALGEAAGLVALSAITGADRAVKTVVPIIDEFRFGTGYSTKTAQTQPTVTVGKRITDSIHASVTTGVGDDAEVRSNVDLRLNRNVSVQLSYDNQNDVSSSPVGNSGVDLRWRIEFE
jgi:translocation and assembly module TamB